MSSKIFAFEANLLNMILATAVFTLPFSIWETGIYLGIGVLLLVCIISFTTCTFLIESIAIANAIYREEKMILVDCTVNSQLDSSNNLKNNFINSNIEDELKSKGEISSIENNSNNEKTNNVVLNNNTALTNASKTDVNDTIRLAFPNLTTNEGIIEDEEKKDNFYIFKRYEILKLAKGVLNKPLYGCVVLVMIGYLYVSITSNAVLMANSIQKILIETFSISGNATYLYYVIASVYYLTISTISLRNIEDLKKFTSIIMGARIIVIILIIVSCFIVIGNYGVVSFNQIPKGNFSNITLMLGNTIFFFMCHHSLPGIVEGFQPQAKLINYLFLGYSMSFVFFVFYGILTSLAFGQYKSCDYMHEFPSAIMNLFNLNFIKFNAIGYIINYYPILNIITGSIQMITLKNNFVVAISGCYPDFFVFYERIRNVRFI